MRPLSHALFWASAAFVGATWVGYPAWLALQRRRPTAAGTWSGRLAVVCVARDEAATIGRRVAELKAQTRAPERVIVVDDGSCDDTARLAAEAGALVVRRPAEGKAAGLAYGVLAAGDVDVVVFCDVRQRLAPDALAQLSRPLADPNVGCVSGLLMQPFAHGPGAYWRYEAWVRTLESRSGSVVGATGALYAIRKDLFVPPPPGLVLDDVWIPMHVAKAGYRVVLASDATAEDVEADVTRERIRKRRTLAGNHELVRAAPWIGSPRQNPLFWRWLWHKHARLVAPYALGLAGAVALVNVGHPFYLGVTVAMGAVAVTYVARKLRPDFLGRVGGLVETFVDLQVVAARSWLDARRVVPWR